MTHCIFLESLNRFAQTHLQGCKLWWFMNKSLKNSLCLNTGSVRDKPSDSLYEWVTESLNRFVQTHSGMTQVTVFMSESLNHSTDLFRHIQEW